MTLDPRVLLRAGVVLCATGFIVLAYTWERVASVLAVPLQLPYVLSGGIGGVILVYVGVSVLRRGVEKREAAETAQRLEDLTAALRALADTRDEVPEARRWTA